MGTLRFRIPSGVQPEIVRDLERACVAGGYDNMPAPTRVSIDGDRLTLSRESSESGYPVAPWPIPGFGRLMGSAATLMEREEPYALLVELARGKVNQVRTQAAEWQSFGFELNSTFIQQLGDLSRRFGHVVTLPAGGVEIDREAESVLAAAYELANKLVHDYCSQLSQARLLRQGKIDCDLAIRLTGGTPEQSSTLVQAFNAVHIAMTWKSIEPTESNYYWDAADNALKWAEENDLSISAGPLINLSPRGLPDWLWLWEGDLQSIASFMCDYVGTAISRYRGRIRRWQIISGANRSGILKLGEEDLLWLTARLAEAAWQVDPDVELVIGLAQPWGEYLAKQEHTYSPFIFADTLIRAGLRLALLDLEWCMGISPHGSYCRDLLDSSKLLDLYGMLGVPLQVTLAYPASSENDARADLTQSVAAGQWGTEISPKSQAIWADAFIRLAIGKPIVRGACWAQLSDADEHSFPNCGLFDSTGQPRPAIEQITSIRQSLLK